MRVDSEFAGLLLAAGFLVMGAVGLDIGKFFVLGAFSLGLAIAWCCASCDGAAELELFRPVIRLRLCSSQAMR